MSTMRYKRLYDGTEVPALGLGTWRMGGGMRADRSSDKGFVKVIRTAIELGYTHIDTAEMYGAGHTEELVGQAIKHYERERLFVTTKVWSNHLRHRAVLDAFDGSLRRLGTEYVDLYLIHWPSASVPLEETFRAFNELVKSGRVRHVGVSNFGLDRLKHAQELSAAPIAANQREYNLLERRPKADGVLEYCQRNGILLIAYEPLATGTVLDRPGVKQLAQRYGATPAQIALYWLIQQPGIVAIPMSANQAHLEENLGALQLDIPLEEIEAL